MKWWIAVYCNYPSGWTSQRSAADLMRIGTRQETFFGVVYDTCIIVEADDADQACLKAVEGETLYEPAWLADTINELACPSRRAAIIHAIVVGRPRRTWRCR